MTTVFDDAAFMSAGQDARFFGETIHRDLGACLQFVIEVGPDEPDECPRLARDGPDEAVPDELCRAKNSFKVDDIPDARAVHRVATAKTSKGAERRRETTRRLLDGFAIGPIVYTLFCTATRCRTFPRTSSAVASAYYDRLTSSDLGVDLDKTRSARPRAGAGPDGHMKRAATPNRLAPITESAGVLKLSLEPTL